MLWPRRPTALRTAWPVVLRLFASLMFVFYPGWGIAALTQEPNPKQELNTELTFSAQDETPAITLDEIKQRITDVQASTELDEATKTSLLGIYNSAQKLLETSRAAQDRAAEFEAAIQSSATLLTTAKEQNQIVRDARQPNFRDQSPEQLKQLLAQKQAELDKAKQTAAGIEGEPARRLQRVGEIPKLIAEIEEKLAENRRQQTAETPPNESAAATQARTMRLRAEEQMFNSELKKLRAEQRVYQVTGESLPLQLETANLIVASLAKEIEALQRLQTQNQKNQSDQLIAVTEADVARAGEFLKPLAEYNLALAKKQKSYLESNANILLKLNKVRDTIAEVDRLQKNTEDRLQAVGLTDALSVMINQQRIKLIKLKLENQPDPELKTELTRMQIESFEMQDELSEIKKETSLPDLIAELEAKNIPDLENQKETARSIIFQKRRLLNDVAGSSESLLNTLSALDSEQRLLSQKIDRYIGFIDQRIVWIRSAAPIGWADIEPGREAMRWFLSGENWLTCFQELTKAAVWETWRYWPPLLGVFVLFLLHRRFKRMLNEAGVQASKNRCSVMVPTWNALLATVLLALPWPFMALLIGTMLRDHHPTPLFAESFGRALIRVAFFLLPIEFLRLTSRKNGLGESHFDWSYRILQMFGKNLRWYYIVSIPLLLVLWTLESQTEESWKNSLGRVCSILFFATTALLLHVIWRPEGVFFQQLASRNNQSQFYRIRMLWYVMMLLIPIGLTVLSVAGYQYTTMILTTGFKNTANVGIVLAISGGMLLRWLLVRRRFLTMEEVRKARAAVPVAIASEASAIPAELAALNKAEQPLLDIASVNRQAREVVVFALSAVGAIWLLWIWRDALPAIEYLEHNELWSVAIGEKIEVVSSRDLLFAGLSFFLTFLMIKNMPGLLNLAAQTYSTLDSGTRYAATTVFRYLITIIGVITGLSFLSIPWSQYSWLVAAATVGIGFGLQEIVANFVSGLILLIERPVRVGDWITIDGTTGVVTKIQMRATTVTNFDNQELVVPNKDLITGKLLNWTLSSVTTRLVLNVGVAYGTDTEFVKKMITDIVKAHPFVLSSPEPAIVLQEFADSALMFVVRVFLPSVENRENVRHELNTSILHAFAEHQISIPFPQRDLHIVTPGWTPEIERSESKRKPRTNTEEQE